MTNDSVPTPRLGLPDTLTTEALETLFATISPHHPWDADDIAAVLSCGTVPDPDHIPLTPTGPVTQTRFTGAAIDLLLHAPMPWPYVATLSPLSDIQFDRFLERIAPIPLFDVPVLALDRSVSSSERLLSVLHLATTWGPFPTVVFWGQVIDRFVTADNLSLFLPVLPIHYACTFAIGRCTITDATAAGVTPERLTALPQLDPTKLLTYLAAPIDSRPPIPSWLCARLFLRVPGLVSALVDELRRTVTSTHPKSRMNYGPLVRAVRRVIAITGTDPAAVQSLLNPSASLADLLVAARCLERVS